MDSPVLSFSCRADPAAWLRLALVPGVPVRAQHKLLHAFGSPEGVLASSVGPWAAVVGVEAAACLARGPNNEHLERTLRWLEGAGNSLVTVQDREYPEMLRQTIGAPTVLYARGRLDLLNVPAFAVVGSRNATPRGCRDAETFAHALSSAGLCIVSGLALGIDAYAHRGGLAGGASSIAVMGTGADIKYPKRNASLADELAERGCLLTEFPLGTPPESGNFPQRNRLISGLARGVLVVEAAARSGSLITAKLANEQGRDVFAIPGSIHSPLSKGCHLLIKDGAKLVESAQDILVELGMRRPSPQGDTEEQAPDGENELLAAMGFGPQTVDQLAELTGHATATVTADLSLLELEGRVEALAGGRYQQVERRS